MINRYTFVLDDCNPITLCLKELSIWLLCWFFSSKLKSVRIIWKFF